MLVQSSPSLGFPLILQLTGVNGSGQFDKLTRTKTIESILALMDSAGIKSYVLSLLEQVNSPKGTEEYSIFSLWRAYKGAKYKAVGSLLRSIPAERGSQTNSQRSFATVRFPKMTNGYKSCLIFTSSMDCSSFGKFLRTILSTRYVTLVSPMCGYTDDDGLVACIPFTAFHGGCSTTLSRETTWLPRCS